MKPDYKSSRLKVKGSRFSPFILHPSSFILSERAFTLLELLISMTILSGIVVIILSGFRIGIHSWEVGERRVEKNQRLRVVTSQIVDEIRSALALKIKGTVEDIEKQFGGFVSESDSLKFVTTTSGLVPSPIGTQLRAVYYKVNSRGLIVWETYLNFEDFFEDPESVGEEILINPDVSNISFRTKGCYTEPGEDGAKPEEVCEWVESWDPINDLIERARMQHSDDKENKDLINYQNLPRAVEITLTLKPETEYGVDEELPPLIIPITTGHVLEIQNDEG